MQYAKRDPRTGDYLVLDTEKDGIFWWILSWLLDKWGDKYAKCANCGAVLVKEKIVKETKNRIYTICEKCGQKNWTPK